MSYFGFQPKSVCFMDNVSRENVKSDRLVSFSLSFLPNTRLQTVRMFIMFFQRVYSREHGRRNRLIGRTSVLNDDGIAAGFLEIFMARKVLGS